MQNVYIIVPAYNEEKNIQSTINSLKKEGYKNIVVVDDGSKDNTQKIASSLKVISLKHIINRGQGASLQTGISYAILNKAKYIVHFDGDGQHNAKEIKNLLQPLITKEAEATLGSRFLRETKNTGLPLIRKLQLKIGILVIFIFYGIKLSDSHNGFRAFTGEAAKKIVITGDRMEHASEIVEKIKENNIKYKEIPVTIKYNEQTLKNGRKGQSKLDAIEIAFKMLLKKLGI